MTSKKQETIDFTAPHLLVVDMQRYYCEPESSYQRYFRSRYPGSMDYIQSRLDSVTIPALSFLIGHFRRQGYSLTYLELCSSQRDRQDLHPHFQRAHALAQQKGFNDLYPLCDDPMARTIKALSPAKGDCVIHKPTYSGFTPSIDSTAPLARHLVENPPSPLLIAGLATSQCVETTARDASERGYQVLLVEEALADYDEITHNASLYSSQGVLGGLILSLQEFKILSGVHENG